MNFSCEHKVLGVAGLHSCWAGPTVPALAAIVILWMLSNTTRRFAIEGLVVAAAASFYFIRTRGGQL